MRCQAARDLLTLVVTEIRRHPGQRQRATCTAVDQTEQVYTARSARSTRVERRLGCESTPTYDGRLNSRAARCARVYSIFVQSSGPRRSVSSFRRFAAARSIALQFERVRAHATQKLAQEGLVLDLGVGPDRSAQSRRWTDAPHILERGRVLEIKALHILPDDREHIPARSA